MAVHSPPIQNAISFKRRYLRIKRILDIVFSLLVLVPLCIVIAIFAVLNSYQLKRSCLFPSEARGDEWS